jgi:hypothetical protein
LAAISVLLFVASCRAYDYEVVLIPGLQTRLAPQAAAELGLATISTWEEEVSALGRPITTPARILEVRLWPTGEAAGVDTRRGDRLVPGPAWTVKAEGTFLFPHADGPPGVGQSGVMLFEDASGELISWGGS